MTHSIWAIVPAAGIGKRMQSDMPKQYLALNGRPVLEYALNTLLQNENISGLIIALQEGDEYWSQIKIDSHKPVLRAKGGKERADSVLNAIETLYQFEQFDESDWVMVHDAVRPCLRQQDINKLVVEVGENQNGGLLALPVRDTMKRQKNNSAPAAVASTIDREDLWHALTPQYFPVLTLKKALEHAFEHAEQGKLSITDESSSMELVGYSPQLIHGAEDNIKITRPDDLRLASLYLQAYDQ
jgi:2-C-methyl-D-erythritol 4-phosphate cytidylyltransferase